MPVGPGGGATPRRGVKRAHSPAPASWVAAASDGVGKKKKKNLVRITTTPKTAGAGSGARAKLDGVKTKENGKEDGSGVRLERPQKPVWPAWPKKELRAFDLSNDVCWGRLCVDVLKARGWRLSAPCHSTMGDDPKHPETYQKDVAGITTVFTREFEASLLQKSPQAAFGKKGAVQEGYQLRTLPLPKNALWMMGRASYRVPQTAGGNCYFREDFGKLVAEHGPKLPDAGPQVAKNYRILKIPGIEVAAYKTNCALAFRNKPWFPIGYVLPKEKAALLRDVKARGSSRSNYWIAKPKGGTSGKGIQVWRGTDPGFKDLLKEGGGVAAVNSGGYVAGGKKPQRSVVQRYLTDPLLVGGYKFHMRIHVAVTSLDPPEAFVQENGQCLFSTLPYSLAAKTLGANFSPPVHVTNMGLNATEENKDAFMKKKKVIGPGQQLRMKDLEAHLSATRPDFDRKKLYSEICEITADTVRYIAQAPSVRSVGKLEPGRHFDILGFDLMLDKDLKVWMCEFNGDPGLEYPDKKILGVPNPDYSKEGGACRQTWHDLLALIGLDANLPQTQGSLKNWLKVDFSSSSTASSSS